ncbi:MAG TPA: hypothetical protein VFH73_25580 [Polyangia bacterium]|jgi:hypothetical protein|nr:hypothetical protein [Polyangia bacterium]
MTKAEEFQRAAEVAAHSKKPPSPSHDSAGKVAARRGRTKDRIPNQASHNQGTTHTKTSSYEFEVTATSRPSRKSTRKALNRQKTDSALRITAMNRTAAASTRAAARRGG